LDLFAQYAAIFFDSHPHGLSPRPRGHTRTTHACHSSCHGCSDHTPWALQHVYLVSSLKHRKSSCVYQRLPLGPREATPVELGTSAGVPHIGPPSSVQSFGTQLEAHREQVGGGAVAFARLLVPFVKIGLIDGVYGFCVKVAPTATEALAKYGRKYILICEGYRG